MSADRISIVEAALDATLAPLGAQRSLLGADDELVPGLTASTAVEIWQAMVTSRALDVAARRLKADGLGHYTISSAGHERMALVAAALRTDDPALLHYRDGGFVALRMQRCGQDVVEATMRAFTADRREPASGGRHKVWGSREAWIVPQTSTIGSHLPKATGLALAIDRGQRLGWQRPLPDDALVVTSIGDASINHASVLSGMNAAAYGRRRGVGVPLLVVVEDNGLGISTPTPRGWVEAWGRAWPHFQYVHVDTELTTAWEQVRDAVRRVREDRAPVVLHLPTVRLWGHAGSDVEQGYRTLAEIRADEARDPVPVMARELALLRACDGPGLTGLLADARARVAQVRATLEPVTPLPDRAAVLAGLPAHDDDEVRAEARAAVVADREELFAGSLPERVRQPARRTLAAWTNAALREVMAARPNTVVLGEDVGRKGGVYGVTAGLQERFGRHRVIDTLLDETAILGAAQGAALAGQLPIAEIQYMAYLHNAIDQLRGEAASTAFFSDGHFRAPLVLRMASFADPAGFGGHFHNDHAVGALREIPGLAIAVPSRGDNAVGLLRAAVAMAARHGRIVALLEPTALYHRRDLFEEGDDAWTSDWPGDDHLLLPGDVGLAGPEDPDVLVVTAGNGVPLSLRVARRLEDDGVAVQVLDLRWLAPLPHAAIAEAAARARAVVVVDESRRSGGWADTVVASLVMGGWSGPLATLQAADSYVPIGPAAPTVLVDEAEVEAAVREVSRRG